MTDTEPTETADTDEMTPRDLLVEVIGMCLKEPETSGEDIITALEQLGATEFIEEAREMQRLLEEEGVVVEEDGSSEPEDG